MIFCNRGFSSPLVYYNYMKRQVSRRRQPWLRTAIYSFMTLTVTVIVAMLMLVVLGYQFNKKDGRIEQGGLLQFESIPTGAAVTLDQLPLSSLTNTKATVDRGNHFVEFNLANYRTWQKNITITPGQIGWLSYARLIPTTVTPKTLQQYTNLSGTLAAPSDKYMLLHQAADSADFILANIEGDTVQYSTVTLPTSAYTAPSAGQAQSFTLESWSQDDQAALVLHTYDGTKTEWLLLNRSSPDKSINLSATYGISPSTVQFAGSGSKLLFARTDNTIQRINLDEQTLSRPLATNVDSFTVYDEKTIIYSTIADDKNQRTIAYAAVDIDSPVALAVFPADGQPLLAAMTSYFNQHYVAIMHGQTLKILTGSLPTATDSGSLQTYAQQTVSATVSALTSSSNDRFFVAQLPTGYATYDIELKKYDETKWAAQPQTPRQIAWLDDFMLWSDYGGELRFYEFDGANQQNIMPVAEGYTVSLSPNGKYIYGVAKTDKGYAFERAQLILQ